jgi:glycosyltransferase involved in cell wall biosynthesis
MRIAQISPIFERVPPVGYGGTERVVSYLTEELVRAGHDVTLFASGDSVTSARLVPVRPRCIWGDDRCRDALPHHVLMMEQVFADITRFDVVHFHTDCVHFPLLRRHPWPNVTSLHGYLNPDDLESFFDFYDDVPLVSISDAQRLTVPRAPFVATVHHGLPENLYTFRESKGGYLAFLGRTSPEKGLDHAIEIACRTGIPLKVGAKVQPADLHYFETTIEPLLRESGSLVEFAGEVGGKTKDDFLGGASALLFPIDWEEPFGLVMIEAMACGTPVIAWRRGSVPEVVDESVTGFIVEDVESATAAVLRIDQIDRGECRRTFERRFTAARMARDYLAAYAHVIERHPVRLPA